MLRKATTAGGGCSHRRRLDADWMLLRDDVMDDGVRVRGACVWCVLAGSELARTVARPSAAAIVVGPSRPSLPMGQRGLQPSSLRAGCAACCHGAVEGVLRGQVGRRGVGGDLLGAPTAWQARQAGMCAGVYEYTCWRFMHDCGDTHGRYTYTV